MVNDLYRAWLKKEKIMVMVDELRWFPAEDENLELYNIWFTKPGSLTRTMRNLNEVILMKFTGDFDIDGNKVYEDDLVEFEIYPGGIYCRGFVNYGRYEIPHKRGDREGYLKLLGPHVFQVGVRRGNKFERTGHGNKWTMPLCNAKVIGDFYQNHDLIEEGVVI